MHSEFAACGFYTAFYVRLLRAASSCGYTASSFLVLMLQNLLRICSGHGSGRRKLSAGRWSAECVWVEAGVGVHVRRHATHDGQRTTGCPSTDLAPAISRAGQVTGARCSTSIMTSRHDLYKWFIAECFRASAARANSYPTWSRHRAPLSVRTTETNPPTCLATYLTSLF